MTTSDADQASEGPHVRQGLPSIITPQHLGPVTGVARWQSMASQQNLALRAIAVALFLTRQISSREV
jgi:hypothetical protein